MLCLYLATYINHENTNNKTQNIFANLSFIRRPPWPQIKAISKLLSLCSYHFGPTCHGWAWNSKTHHWQTRRNVSSPPRPPWVPRGSTLWPRLQSCHLLDCYNHEPLVPPPPPLLPSSCPHIKLEVPCFDGHNPLGWIFKISQFFEYQATPKEEYITLASFYLNGPALSWFSGPIKKLLSLPGQDSCRCWSQDLHRRTTMTPKVLCLNWRNEIRSMIIWPNSTNWPTRLLGCLHYSFYTHHSKCTWWSLALQRRPEEDTQICITPSLSR